MVIARAGADRDFASDGNLVFAISRPLARIWQEAVNRDRQWTGVVAHLIGLKVLFEFTAESKVMAIQFPLQLQFGVKPCAPSQVLVGIEGLRIIARRIDISSVIDVPVYGGGCSEVPFVN